MLGCCYIQNETAVPTFAICHMRVRIFGDSASTDTKPESVGHRVAGEVASEMCFSSTTRAGRVIEGRMEGRSGVKFGVRVSPSNRQECFKRLGPCVPKL